MTEYKSYRIVDGKPRWVIVDEDGKIVNINPSKEELKDLEIEKYKQKRNASSKYTNEDTYKKLKRYKICCNCKSHDTYITTSSWEQWHTHKCQKITCTEYLCHNCYNKLDPNSYTNMRKSLANRRTGNLNPNSNQAKGDNFEELTRMWRSKISTIPVENLNKKLDNYETPIDHSWDSELGIPQTKGRFYDSRNGWWNFGGLEREWEKEFDVIICYCASKDGKIIERIYIIPFKKEIKKKRKGVIIYKNPTNSHGNPKTSWYDEYRVTDEETIRRVNNIWKEIITK